MFHFQQQGAVATSCKCGKVVGILAITSGKHAITTVCIDSHLSINKLTNY